MVNMEHITFVCVNFHYEQRCQEFKHIDSVGLVITSKSQQVFLSYLSTTT